MQSKAATVEQYIAELPPDRREAIQTLRAVILRNLDPRYEERMGYGMMGYAVPHSIYPAGYHCDPKQPLPFAGLASQKNHLSVYIMSLYGPDGDEAWFRDAWAATGKKLDMGKCCVRFKRIEDAALDVIGEAIRRMPVDRWIKYYEAGLAQADRDREARRAERGAGGTKRAVSASTRGGVGGKASGAKGGRAGARKGAIAGATGNTKTVARQVGKNAAKKTAKRVAKKVAKQTAAKQSGKKVAKRAR